jgi:protein-arginine kinase activator protein McsA
LREYLAVHYEMSESQLAQTIDAHISAMKQIEEENKKKAEAIEQEEFELASKCKKVIDSLKTKLLSPQSI